MHPFALDLIKTYNLDTAKLPASYKKFLQNIDSYTGKKAEGFMGYDEDEPLVVGFTTPWLLEEQEVFEDNDIDREENPTLIPFLQIDPFEPNFLLVDISDEDCPVVMWEHETGEFEEIAASLEDFLSDLK